MACPPPLAGLRPQIFRTEAIALAGAGQEIANLCSLGQDSEVESRSRLEYLDHFHAQLSERGRGLPATPPDG